MDEEVNSPMVQAITIQEPVSLLHCRILSVYFTLQDTMLLSPPHRELLNSGTVSASNHSLETSKSGPPHGSTGSVPYACSQVHLSFTSSQDCRHCSLVAPPRKVLERSVHYSLPMWPHIGCQSLSPTITLEVLPPHRSAGRACSFHPQGVTAVVHGF